MSDVVIKNPTYLGADQTVWVYRDKQGREFECEPVNGVPPLLVSNSMPVYILDKSRPYLKSGEVPHMSGKIIYDAKDTSIVTPDGGFFGKGPSEIRGTTYNQLYFGERLGFKAKIDADMYSRGLAMPFGCEGVVTIMKSPECFGSDDLVDLFRFLASGVCAGYLDLAEIYLREHPDHDPRSKKVSIESDFIHVELMLDERSINQNSFTGAS